MINYILIDQIEDYKKKMKNYTLHTYDLADITLSNFFDKDVNKKGHLAKKFYKSFLAKTFLLKTLSKNFCRVRGLIFPLRGLIAFLRFYKII